MTIRAEPVMERTEVGIPRAVPSEAQAIIDRAGRLTRTEIARLDRAARIDAAASRVAFALLRDAFNSSADERSWRYVVGNSAWRAVSRSCMTAGLRPLSEDYWLVSDRPGAGAARAAAFAACVALGNGRLDEVAARVLARPWSCLGALKHWMPTVGGASHDHL